MKNRNKNETKKGVRINIFSFLISFQILNSQSWKNKMANGNTTTHQIVYHLHYLFGVC